MAIGESRSAVWPCAPAVGPIRMYITAVAVTDMASVTSPTHPQASVVSSLHMFLWSSGFGTWLSGDGSASSSSTPRMIWAVDGANGSSERLAPGGGSRTGGGS